MSEGQREAIADVINRVYHDQEFFIDALEDLVVGQQRNLLDNLLAQFRRSGRPTFGFDEVVAAISAERADLSTKWYGDVD